MHRAANIRLNSVYVAARIKPWPTRGAIQCSGQWMQRIVNMRLNSACVAARISPGHTGVKFSARDNGSIELLT